MESDDDDDDEANNNYDWNFHFGPTWAYLEVAAGAAPQSKIFLLCLSIA